MDYRSALGFRDIASKEMSPVDSNSWRLNENENGGPT